MTNLEVNEAFDNLIDALIEHKNELADSEADKKVKNFCEENIQIYRDMKRQFNNAGFTKFGQLPERTRFKVAGYLNPLVKIEEVKDLKGTRWNAISWNANLMYFAPEQEIIAVN